jgi:hypothetical protein
MGADFVSIGFIFESFTSSFSTLRCSCGWGRLVCVMAQFSHSVGRRRSAHFNAPFTRRSLRGSSSPTFVSVEIMLANIQYDEAVHLPHTCITKVTM